MPLNKILAHGFAFLGAATLTAAAHATNVVLVNTDPPGSGLNDPTPVEPLPDNPGTTIGQQRFNAFQSGADKWGATLQSDVPIFVAASFSPRPCTATSGVLASAGPASVFADFPGAEKADTWYVGALADALTGVDLDPGAIDAVAFFNSDLGTPGCLENSGWYYGLDGNEAPNEIDFLAVVTHELAHGLGFLELVSESTGALFIGRQDIYSTFMFDTNQGKFFNEMTDAERLQAQVSSGSLVWTGENVTAQAPAVLGPRPSIQILRPKALKGFLDAQQASFGPPLVLNGGMTGQVALADDDVEVPTDACEPITDRSLRGKIALIDRGGCAFTTKVLNAQAAGAKGAIVANNQPGGPAPMGGFSPFVTIPSVGITLEQGDAIKDAGKVNLKLILNPSKLAGANDDGQVLLYAPNPVQPGSSKSHFDTSAEPSLLMEPSITSGLDAANDIDLTPALFDDLGWVLQ
jgi:hypothetical protein